MYNSYTMDQQIWEYIRIGLYGLMATFSCVFGIVQAIRQRKYNQVTKVVKTALDDADKIHNLVEEVKMQTNVTQKEVVTTTVQPVIGIELNKTEAYNLYNILVASGRSSEVAQLVEALNAFVKDGN